MAYLITKNIHRFFLNTPGSTAVVLIQLCMVNTNVWTGTTANEENNNDKEKGKSGVFQSLTQKGWPSQSQLPRN